MPDVAACEEPDAAAVDRGGDVDVEALLQRLQPAQRHADAGIRLAGGDRLEELVGRAAEIDQLDLEIVLGEDAALIGDRHTDGADRIGVPGQLQLTRRTVRDSDRRGRDMADLGMDR